jgi:flagellar basal-body rod protein FlgF
MIGMLEAVRGCVKEEVRADVIANNLANASVIGFKRDRISFKNMLMGTDQGSTDSTSGTTDTSGTQTDLSLVHIQTDFSGGPLRHTGNSLDVALNGRGFFKIQTPDGVRYTRKGNFSCDGQGVLMTQDGNPVLGKGGPITISGKDVVIDKSGRVLVDGSEVGQLDLTDVAQPELLEKVGGTFFSAAEGTEELPLPEETSVKQEYVEDSNVNIPEEMVTMIHSLRAYESYQKAIQVLDGLNNKAINDVSTLK